MKPLMNSFSFPAPFVSPFNIAYYLNSLKVVAEIQAVWWSEYLTAVNVKYEIQAVWWSEYLQLLALNMKYRQSDEVNTYSC